MALCRESLVIKIRIKHAGQAGAEFLPVRPERHLVLPGYPIGIEFQHGRGDAEALEPPVTERARIAK